MSTEDELRKERRSKAEKMRALSVDPFGGRFTEITSVADVQARAEELQIETGAMIEDQRARVAGRVVLQRVMGNLVFLTVRDATGDLQFGLSKRSLKDSWPVIKLLDLGDIIGGDGCLGRTKTGELTLWLDGFKVLCKSLHPPPEKWHGLTDKELRYRHRYVDLFSNPEVQTVFKQRSAIVQAVRDYLISCDYIEVETPSLQPIYGGAAARPFTTHHNALDIDLFLRISPELYLKRLLVGGMERVFEVSRNFRNEGISYKHNPEFTMVELYEAYADYEVMMERVEGMTALAIERLDGNFKRTFGEQEIDFTLPWSRRKYSDLLEEYGGVAMGDDAAVRAKATEVGIDHKGMADAVVVSEVFDRTVEKHLIQPTFVYDYPAAICPLTRRHPDNPELALRFEAVVCGMELGNAYTELNDPEAQRANFEQQVAGQDETMAIMDEDFV